MTQHNSAKNSKMGRPPVDSEAVNVRLQRDLLLALDQARLLVEPEATRPEVIRKILTDWLQENNHLKGKKKMSMGLSLARVPVGNNIRKVTFSPKAFENSEQFSKSLAKIITTSSLIESVLGGILGSLMHADHLASIALLKKQNSSHQRIQLVTEVAQVTLSENEFKKVKHILGNIKAYSEKRNDIVHGLWGVCEEEPELMFWLKSNDLATLAMSGFQDLVDGDNMKTVDEVTERIKHYRISDMQKIEDDGSEILEHCFKYYTSSLATYAARKITGNKNITINLDQSS